jgi:hypothetical protein
MQGRENEKRMQQMRVTSGAGRLDRPLVKHLSRAGYRGRGMSRRAGQGEGWPGSEWQQADLLTSE